MEINIKLKKSDKGKKGHPIILEITHGFNRRRKTIFHSSKLHWDDNDKTITRNHPEYHKGIVILLNLKQKIQRLDLRFEESIDKIYNYLFDCKPSFPSAENHILENNFIEFSKFYEIEKKGLESYNTSRWYKFATNKLSEVHGNNILFEQFDYNFLNKFILYLEKEKLTISSINNYLRALRAIYNEGCKRYNIKNTEPFKGLRFMTVKHSRNKKKNITKYSLRKLVEYPTKNKSVDFFLLSFYLGGMNLKDIYYLKEEQIYNGRIYMKRNKIENGYEFDLKIFPEAQKIIEYYAQPKNGYIFPFSKEKSRYDNFISNRLKHLKSAQKILGIEVLPTGGNLSFNVTRHTFSTIGAELGISRELRKLLMGHEMDDIQAVYEYYSEKIRDEAHYKIINLYEDLQ